MEQHLSLRIIRSEHAALAAMLRSLLLLIERGPARDEPQKFFEVLRAMLFYIDEFPERLHHPKESALLFPKVAERAPQTGAAIARLDQEHRRGEAAVRELQHGLLAWELLGGSRRAAFEDAARRYVGFYLEHMRLEETVVLPASLATLDASDWVALDAAFSADHDPLATTAAGSDPDPQYERLFARILRGAPAPIGLG